MGEAIGTLLQLMLTALGVVPLPEPGMVGVAALAVALAALVLTVALVLPDALLRSAPHPRRAIDVSVLLAQSHPDAGGHPRPRAPGVASAA